MSRPMTTPLFFASSPRLSIKLARARAVLPTVK